jgi:hypothetical protein
VCPKGREWSPGGPAEVLNSYQPGTEKCNWEAAAAGGNTALVCPKGRGWSPGGPAEVLNSHQPGTEKCNWEAAAAGGNTTDLVSQR